MFFKSTLIITGTILVGIGTFAMTANRLRFIDVPEYSDEGNIITGVVMFLIGIYIVLLGISDNTK